MKCYLQKPTDERVSVIQKLEVVQKSGALTSKSSWDCACCSVLSSFHA